MPNNPPNIPSRSTRVLLLAGFAVAVLAKSGFAQNVFDYGTPAESKGGLSSISGYAQSKIETVNLANGNLNLHIPLVTVGGRGAASFTVALNYNSKLWGPQHDVETDGTGTLDHYTAMYDDLVGKTPNVINLGSGWSILKAPAIKVRLITIWPVTNHGCNVQGSLDRYALTKVWFVMPDGSEIELRDDVSDGAPYFMPCPPRSDRDRGRVWHSVNGEAITYVTDAPNGVVTGQLRGYVFLPDGTRLFMHGDAAGGAVRCQRIIDPNGNQLDIDYDIPVAGAVTYTDQLGRKVVVQPVTNGATVTIKGWGSVGDRSYSVVTGQIAPFDNGSAAPNLRLDYQNTTLWPRPFISGDLSNSLNNSVNQHSLYGSSPHTDLIYQPNSDPTAINNSDIYGGATTISSPQVTAVMQLNLLDGRSFNFHYNPWGEVAEIVYPGGGVSQIDYSPYTSGLCESGLLGPMLNRRVVQRHELSDGVHLDTIWSYTRTDASPYPYVTVAALQGGTNATLMSEKHYFMALDAQFGGCRFGTHNEMFENAKEVRVERQTANGTQMLVETRTWENRTPQVWGADPGSSVNEYAQSHGQENGPNDPRVKIEDTTLENGKLKRVEYGYDDLNKFNNVKSIKEYDFGQGAQGTLLRETTRTYLNMLNGYCYTNLNGVDGNCGAGVYATVEQAIHRRRLLLNETVTNSLTGAIEAYTEYEYDNYVNDGGNHAAIQINSAMIQYDGTWFSPFATDRQPRGNVTQVKRLISGSPAPDSGTYATSYSQYDNAGNVVKTIDPRGNSTTLSYADNFGDGSNPDVGASGTNGATFAFATSVTNALNQTAKTQYDYARGVASGAKDPNLVITKSDHNDPFDRITQVTAGYGLSGSNTSLAQFTYPTASSNTTTVTKQLDDTRWLTYRDSYDGFERAVGAAESEDGSQSSTNFTITSTRILDGLGRIRFASNPSRGSGASTNGWMRNTYDLEGRVTEVASFSGDTQPPDSGTNASWTGSVVTTFNGEVTTVRDQANKQRRSTVDGLGRLTSVDELFDWPSASVYSTTTYGYDARGNLKSISQSGQSRIFSYDGLSRLTDATNPENGHIGYTYDSASNLVTKTDGRFMTTYGYDSLNRVLTRTYTGTPATPSVTYAYDTSTNGVGRLTSVTTSGVSTYTYASYDAMGRPSSCSQEINGQTYTMGATYNKAGMELTETYPSGRVISTAYDNAGRLNGITGQKTGEANKTYASSFSYTAHGAIGSMQLGNNLWEHTNFNSRLQPTQIGLGTASSGTSSTSVLGLDYSFGASASTNNGNVQSQTITVGTSGTVINQSYTYDQVNRLQTATESVNATQQWNQSYGYDVFGNRWVTGYVPNTTLTPQSSNAFNAANNRLLMGFSHYDGSGNLDTDAAGSTFTYDGENRQVTANVNSQPATYSYDGDGHRVMKVVGTGASAVTTVFVYDAMGKLIAEYASDPVPPAPNGGGTSYLTTDHLGSTRVVTKSNQTVQARYDYLPFGEESGAGVGGRTTAMGYSGVDSTRQKFTQKERDSESGLDYFLARYYSSAQGRFTSPDEFTGGPGDLFAFADTASVNPTFYADPRNPQSLNKYQYSYNNPLRYVDPNGHDPAEPDPDPDPQQREHGGSRGGPPPPPLTLPADQAEALTRKIIEAEGSFRDTSQGLPVIRDIREWGWVRKIREWIGTEPAPAPVPVPDAAVPVQQQPQAQPQTATPPQQQAQPMPPPAPMQAHRSGKRKSTEEKHDAGKAREKQDYGRERGDESRRLPRRPPGGKTPKGGWPPKPPKKPTA